MKNNIKTASHGEYEKIILPAGNEGPLKKSVSAAEYRKIINSPKTIFAEISIGSTQRLLIPAICEASLLDWINQENSNELYEAKNLDYFLLSPLIDNSKLINFHFLLDFDKWNTRNRKLLLDVAAQNEVEAQEKITKFMKRNNIDVTSKEGSIEYVANYFIDVRTKAITFFHRVRPAKNVKQAAKLSKSEKNEIARIYELPFNKLAEQHPVGGAYSREEIQVLLDSEDVIVAFHKEQGRIISAMLFSNDLRLFNWLDQGYYKKPQKGDSKLTYYIPLIVTNGSSLGKFLSLKVIVAAFRYLANLHSSFSIAFECSTISDRYVPKIVSRIERYLSFQMKSEMSLIEKRYYCVVSRFHSL